MRRSIFGRLIRRKDRKDSYPMHIVSQYAVAAHSQVPVYLLPAPPVRLALPEPPHLKLLPAPRPVALLAAPAQPISTGQLQIVVDRATPNQITFAAPRPFRT